LRDAVTALLPVCTTVHQRPTGGAVICGTGSPCFEKRMSSVSTDDLPTICCGPDHHAAEDMFASAA
jgi:hypothetical protein